MVNWLYPQPGQNVTFELMERAAWMVIQKDKNYPAQQFSGIGAIAKAVYKGRIFAFRYKRLFKAKAGALIGGAISSLGILLVYQDRMVPYFWRDITECKVNITSIISNSNQNYRGYTYTVELRIGTQEYFLMNPNGVIFNEFGGGKRFKSPQQADADDEKVAELFALYYNRFRSEHAGFILRNNSRRVFLHYPPNQTYQDEVLQRFRSQTGVIFKKRLSFKRLEISQDAIIIYKRKGKKIETLIRWETIKNIYVALGASYALWIIEYKPGVNYTHEFIWINSWTPNPAFVVDSPAREKQLRQMILPLCWITR